MHNRVLNFNGTLEAEKVTKLTKMAYLSGNAYKYADVKKLPPRVIKKYGRILVYTQPEKMTHTIVVRGSMLLKNPKDLLMNVNIKEASFNDYIVHAGFFNEAKQIHDELISKNVIEPSYKVELTGHSSGGCIACILGMLMYDKTDNVKDILTFGQPKCVKDIDITYGYPLNVTRIVNIADPVPILPIWGYTHIGKSLIIDTHNHGDIPNLTAHEMRSYINNLILHLMRPV